METSVEDPRNREDSDLTVIADPDKSDSDEPVIEPEPPSDDGYVDV